MELNIKSGCYTLRLNVPEASIGTASSASLPLDMDCSNPQNPLDEVGKAHNYVLESLAKDASGKEWDDATLLKQVVGMVRTYPFASEDLRLAFTKEGDGIIDCFGGWSYKAGAALVTGGQPVKVTLEMVQILQRVEDAGVGISSLGTMLTALDNGKTNAKELIHHIKVLEQQALAAKLNDSDRDAILATLAISRHSTHFWASKKANATAATPGGPILSDAKGAAGGAAAGVITGAGVVVCALVGGIGRSLGYWFGSK